MESLYFLIPLSVLVCIVGVAIFFWAVNSGQYDDLDAEGEKILFDDETDFALPPGDDQNQNSESQAESLKNQTPSSVDSDSQQPPGRSQQTEQALKP